MDFFPGAGKFFCFFPMRMLCYFPWAGRSHTIFRMMMTGISSGISIWNSSSADTPRRKRIWNSFIRSAATPSSASTSRSGAPSAPWIAMKQCGSSRAGVISSPPASPSGCSQPERSPTTGSTSNPNCWRGRPDSGGSFPCLSLRTPRSSG